MPGDIAQMDSQKYSDAAMRLRQEAGQAASNEIRHQMLQIALLYERLVESIVRHEADRERNRRRIMSELAD